MTMHFFCVCVCSLPVQADLRGRRLRRPVGGTSPPGTCTHTGKPFPGPDAQLGILPIRGAGRGEGDAMIDGKSVPWVGPE